MAAFDATKINTLRNHSASELSKLIITKEQILEVRNHPSLVHGRHMPILGMQRRSLLELLQLENPSHEELEIQGMTNGFKNDDSTTYVTTPDVCFQHTGVRPGDILTYRVSFDGLEAMVLGCTADLSKVAVLNLNYEDSRYIIEHYEDRYVFGGFPNPQDVRKLSEELVDWMTFDESETESDSLAGCVHNGAMVVVKKEELIKIRKMEKRHGHLSITKKQRKELWKLFRMHDCEFSYLRMEGLVDGFATHIHGEEPEPFYITIPKIVQSFGNHGLSPGDIITYSVSYTGLEGMVLGVTRDRRQIAVLNLNYGQERYLLEHYSIQNIFGGYPSINDKRQLTSKFVDRGLENSDVKQYHDQVLLPFLKEQFLHYQAFVPVVLIETIAEYVAEMTSIEDFALLLKKKSRSSLRCIIS